MRTAAAARSFGSVTVIIQKTTTEQDQVERRRVEDEDREVEGRHHLLEPYGERREYGNAFRKANATDNREWHWQSGT